MSSKKCQNCGYIGFRKKHRKIKQNIEMCVTCGFEIDTNSVNSDQEVKG
jgi:predicted RNA-binding Zn-ribbon protein involved in translation (DUF1610 family)